LFFQEAIQDYGAYIVDRTRHSLRARVRKLDADPSGQYSAFRTGLCPS
jgi:hypothetical protein